MGAELTLRYSGAEELAQDFETNLRKGRAFVPGATGVPQRAACTLHIEHPEGGATLDLAAEAVWVSEHPETGGIGLELVNFDAQARDTLQAFVAASGDHPHGISGTRRKAAEPLDAVATPEASDEAVSQTAPTKRNLHEAAPTARNLHERVRELSLEQRQELARTGGLPERVALERRYGGSVWEGLLQNPMLTSREVCQMAKSPNLPTHLVNLIAGNAGWLADPTIRAALLQNPRVTGAHLERVLRGASQVELRALSEQNSARMQVRSAAKRLVRR